MQHPAQSRELSIDCDDADLLAAEPNVTFDKGLVDAVQARLPHFHYLQKTLQSVAVERHRPRFVGVSGRHEFDELLCEFLKSWSGGLILDPDLTIRQKGTKCSFYRFSLALVLNLRRTLVKSAVE